MSRAALNSKAHTFPCFSGEMPSNSKQLTYQLPENNAHSSDGDTLLPGRGSGRGVTLEASRHPASVPALTQNMSMQAGWSEPAWRNTSCAPGPGTSCPHAPALLSELKNTGCLCPLLRSHPRLQIPSRTETLRTNFIPGARWGPLAVSAHLLTQQGKRNC